MMEGFRGDTIPLSLARITGVQFYKIIDVGPKSVENGQSGGMLHIRARRVSTYPGDALFA